MSLFRTLDRTSAVSDPGLARPLLAFLWLALHTKSPRRSFSKTAVNRPPRLRSVSVEHMDSFFIQALARAGSCPEHAKQISTLRDIVPFTAKHHKLRRKSTLHNHERREFKSTKAERRGPLKLVKQFAERELKALVDYYGIDLASRPEKDDTVDDGPLVWNVGDDHQPWPVHNQEDATTIAKIEEMLKDEETRHEKLYDVYKLLPAPGVVYLKKETIRALLHHLSVMERPTPAAMQRFLSILDDMNNAHIHIIRTEWTTAIHLAGRFMGKVTADQVQSALYLWRDMEKRAAVRGGRVTLNVLFDVAVKAGKYTLAEQFLKEMQARKLKFHRHFRVSLIYYYGVLQNGNGVRRTYQGLVEAGDIVDTVVMNSVIAALVRAGEPSAAEQVFERMKRLNAAKTKPFPGDRPYSNRDWRGRRILGLHLTHEARTLTRLGALDQRKELQDFAPIAPDTRTYGLLIRHHARTAGNIDRVYGLLQEMRYNDVPLDGTIFIVIFHGFVSFGGVRYSSWTRDKLEKLWSEYLKSVEENLERTFLSKMAIVSALKAFRKCTDAERTLRAWEEVRPLWSPKPDDLEAVLQTLARLVPQQGFFDEYRGV